MTGLKVRPPKTMRALASYIAKHEGKKSQVKIGDVREILAKLSDLFVHDYWGYDNVINLLLENGYKRLRSRARKQKS